VLPDNPRLAAALAAAAHDPTAHGDVLEAILAGTLIVALTPAGGATPHPVAVAFSPGGPPCALAFSGPRPLALWAGTDRTASGPGRAMAALIRDHGLTAAALDVAGPVAAVLEHGELRALASGAAAGEVDTAAPLGERPAPLRLRAPDPPLDPAVGAALAGALARHPAVAAAFVFEGARTGDRRHLVVGLEVPARDPAAVAAAVDAVDAAVAPLVAPAAGVDYTVIERDAVFGALREAVPPAYVSRSPPRRSPPR
jgi:hypothetical protein